MNKRVKKYWSDILFDDLLGKGPKERDDLIISTLAGIFTVLETYYKTSRTDMRKLIDRALKEIKKEGGAI